MDTAGKQRWAPLWLTVGAILIGTNGLMVLFAKTPPTVSAFWRMLFAGVLLTLLCVVTGRWHRWPGRAWWWMTVPAVLFAWDLWFWHRSILLVGAGIATLLTNTQVFFMVLAGMALYRERVGIRFLIGAMLAFIGLWLLLGDGWERREQGYFLGIVLGIASAVCYTGYNLGLRRSLQEVMRQAGGANVLQVLAMISLGSAAMLGISGWVEGVKFAIPTFGSLGWLLALAMLGHCLSWGLISSAVPYLRVAMIGLILMLQPIVAFLLDVALFDRATSFHEWLGLAVSLAGLFLASLKSRKKPAIQEPDASI